MLARLRRILRWRWPFFGTSTPQWTPSALHRRAMGHSGEQAASVYLRKRGFRVLGRNLRVPMGEADLLCEAPDRRTIVLVEVKTRSTESTQDGRCPPELSVHQRKRRTLSRILRYLCAANRWEDRPSRIDVVAVEFHDGRVAAIRHHPDAVR